MGDHHQQLRLPADLEALLERFEDSVAVVAHVGPEHAPVGGRYLREFDDLVALRIVAGRVLPGAENASVFQIVFMELTLVRIP